jgi:hypothetical protein
VNLLIIFLVGSFFVAGTRLGNELIRRPLLQLVACVAIAATYYSLRVVQ